MEKGEISSNFQRIFFFFWRILALSKLSESKELHLAGMQCELMVYFVYDSWAGDAV